MGSDLLPRNPDNGRTINGMKGYRWHEGYVAQGTPEEVICSRYNPLTGLSHPDMLTGKESLPGPPK